MNTSNRTSETSNYSASVYSKVPELVGRALSPSIFFQVAFFTLLLVADLASARDTRPSSSLELFESFDLDSDGSLSLNEFSAMPVYRGKSVQAADAFAKFDINGDGALDLAEFRMELRTRIFVRLDQNKDGLLSIEEYSDAPTAQLKQQDKKDAMFKKLDTDGDGFLSVSEFAGAEQASGEPQTNDSGGENE